MKLKVEAKELERVVSSAALVANSNGTIPILGMLRICATGDEVCAMGTDLDRFVVATSKEAEIDEEGDLCVSASRLAAVAKKSWGLITISSTDKMLRLAAGTAVYELATFDSEEFPPLPAAKDDDVVASGVRLQNVLAGMGAVLPCVSTDESRYVLNGICLSAEKSEVRCVATDGRRLAICTSDSDEATFGESIIPTKAVKTLLKLFSDAGEPVLDLFKKWAQFRDESIVLYTKLIDGTYPNWKQVVPDTASANRITTERESLIASLDAAAIVLTRADTPSLKLDFGKKITITANAPDVGSATVEAPARLFDAEATAALNPYYLLDALKATEWDEVDIYVTDELSPITVVAQTFMSVIMPMRAN